MQGRIFYGWVVVAVAFVTMAVAVNARTGYSLLFPAISAEFGWSSATIVGAFALGFLASSAFIPVVGIVMDKYGPRAAIPMGAIMVAAGYAGAVFVATPVGLYISLGLLAVMGSMSMSYIGHSMFLPNWFIRNRGLAVGIAFSGVGVGAVLLLPALQWAIDAHGWRMACTGTAVLVLAVIVPLNVAFQRFSPETMGLRPDGDREPGTPGARSTPDAVVDRAWADTEWTFRLAVRTARFWWVGLSYFCGLFVWYAIQVHQTKFLLRAGFDPTEAATALGLVALFGIGGQIALGALSDRIGREVAWTIATAGFAISAALLLLLESNPDRVLLYAMVAAQGLFGYGLASMYGAIPAELFAGRQFGRIFSALTLVGNFGAAAGVFVLGLIDDFTGSYAPGWMLCLAAAGISAAAIWLAAPRKVRLVAGRARKRAAA